MFSINTDKTKKECGKIQNNYAYLMKISAFFELGDHVMKLDTILAKAKIVFAYLSLTDAQWLLSFEIIY